MMELLISEVQRRNVLWNKRHSRYKDRLVVDREWDSVAKSVGYTKDEAKKKWRNLRDQFAKELKKIPKPKSGDPAPEYPGKWQYFTALLFLKDTLTPRDTEGNLPNTGPLQTTDHDVLTLSEDSQLHNRYSDVSSDEDNENLTRGTTGMDMTMFRSGVVEEASTSSTVSATSSSTAQCLHINTPSPSQTLKPSVPKRRKKKSPVASVERQLLEMECKKLDFLEQPEDDDLLFLKSLLPYFKEMSLIQKLRVRNTFQNILIKELINPGSTDDAQCSASPVVTKQNQNSSDAALRPITTGASNNVLLNSQDLSISSPPPSAIQGPPSNIPTEGYIPNNELGYLMSRNRPFLQ